MGVEVGLAGEECFELAFKPKVDLFPFLLHILLPICHCLLLMSNGNHLRIEVLLHLDVAIGVGHSYGV
jgi:hypothetical protein